MDSSTGKVLTGPHLQARGMAEDQDKLDQITPQVKAALESSASSSNASTHQMQQAMRRVVGRWASKSLRRSPMIIPTVVEA